MLFAWIKRWWLMLFHFSACGFRFATRNKDLASVTCMLVNNMIQRANAAVRLCKCTMQFLNCLKVVRMQARKLKLTFDNVSVSSFMLWLHVARIMVGHSVVKRVLWMILKIQCKHFPIKHRITMAINPLYSKYINWQFNFSSTFSVFTDKLIFADENC